MGGDHDGRVRDLLDRMTVAEKLGQLQQFALGAVTGPGDPAPPDLRELVAAGRVGSLLTGAGVARINEVQAVAVEESRLGIPLVFAQDVIHGFLTTFPIPMAQAASFDPGVAALDGRTAAREARASGIHWTFTPGMDVSREPRWGRIGESGGEDPYLNAVFAAAKVRALQGSDLAGPASLAACAKHFAAYGQVEGGRDYNTVDVSEQRLRNLYLEPFRAAVGAGVATVMAAFKIGRAHV
jgi:beta-glucosidase